jgi:hypothetical protein
MRGELDDALARLRRWDEVRQRLATGSGRASVPGRPAEPPAAHGAAPVPASEPAPTPGPAVEEMINAIGEIVRRHPQLTVAVTIAEAGTSWTAELVGRENAEPAVTRLEYETSTNGVAPAPQVRPPTLPGRPESAESAERTTARLAELIRQDPSLLDPPDETLP